ncbi:hypothetical protein E0H86_05875 [Acinetobacter sp. ANC 4635]|uniref:hypothetical protein n=1 Tax=Acinetobacter sp. ANC 4635 TaxID=2529846 RepID=UPI001038B13E|nr:hypothetical protein [Acinetobacter sp. ANC 4635]TCB31948.1 hypothetical protein E0H86_05875 [Acinetobacter sp. ANC 4635]
MNITQLFICTISVIFINGCASFLGGSPQAWDYKAEKVRLNQSISLDYMKEYYSIKDEMERKDKLREYAAVRIRVIDITYLQYVIGLNNNRKNSSFLSSTSSSLISTTSSLITPNTTKSILGAISASITGIQATSEKEYFLDKTMEALISQMNANRSQRLSIIIKGLNSDSNKYGLIELNSDLDEYYKAGLVQNAIQVISANAQKNNIDEKEKLDDVKMKKYDLKNMDTNGVKIDNWLKNGGVTNDRCRYKFISNDGETRLIDLLYDESYKEQRATIVSKLEEGTKKCPNK